MRAKLATIFAFGVLVVGSAVFWVAIAGNVANVQGGRLSMHDHISATVHDEGLGRGRDFKNALMLMETSGWSTAPVRHSPTFGR